MSENISKHQPEHTLAILQRTLRRSDKIRGNVTILRAEEQSGKKYTIGEHNFEAEPLGPLTLIELDESGLGTAPDGTTVVIKGTAWLDNKKKNIGVCR